VNATEFLAAAQEVHNPMPDAELVKNQVGNLAIVAPDGGYVGWVDLGTGEVGFNWWESTPETQS